MTTKELIKALTDALDDAAMQRRAGWTEGEIAKQLTVTVEDVAAELRKATS